MGRWRRLLATTLLLAAVAWPGVAWAMPPALALVATWVVQYGATAGYIAAATAGYLTAAIFVTAMVYGSVQQSRLAKRNRTAYNDSLQDRTITVMTAEAPWQVIYGEAVVGGRIAAMLTSGDRDQYKHLVIVWADHECDAITDVLIGGQSIGAADGSGMVTGGKWRKSETALTMQSVTLDGAGSATLTYPPEALISLSTTVVSGDNQDTYYLDPLTVTVVGSTITVQAGDVSFWAGKEVTVNYDRNTSYGLVRVHHHLGTADQLADATLVAEVPADWSATDRLRGKCYSVVRLDLNEPEFQGGPPQITVRVRGKKVYDPRTLATVWSDNPALCTADFLTAEYGKRALSAQLDWASVSAAANDCDTELPAHAAAPLYTCNGAFTTDRDPDTTLDELCQAMAGFATWTGVWHVQAGVYTAPVMALADADAAGSIEVLASPPGGEIFNGVRGKFFDPARYDQLTDYPPYANAAFVAEDAAALWEDLNLPYTSTDWRAHNLARVFVERSRGMQLVFPAKLRAVRLRVGQRVTLSNSMLGIVSSVFRVVKKEYRLGQPVQLSLVQDDATYYDQVDAPASLASPASALPDPFVVAAPASVVAASGVGVSTVTSDGAMVVNVKLVWAASTDALVASSGAMVVEYRLHDDTEWLRAPEAPGSSTGTLISGLRDKRLYVGRVRWRNGIGAVSDWRTWSVLAEADTTLPPNVAGLAYTLSTGGVRVTWTPWDHPMYAYTRLSVGATFAGSTFSWQGAASEAYVLLPANGTYTVWAVHVDRLGRESLVPASLAVEYDDLDVYTNFIFGRFATQPETPVGDPLPAGWYDAPPPADGNPLWLSQERRLAAGVLVGARDYPVLIEQPGLQLQYSVDGMTGWHADFAPGDLFLRYSKDGWVTWSQAFRIVGEDRIWAVIAFESELSSSDPTKGSTLVKYVAANTAAQGRSLQDKLRERISALDFMTDEQRADVVGNVGSLDVTTGIQAAIDYLQAAGRGGIVWLPAGRYRITANLLITWPNAAGPDEPSRVVLQGDGPGMTIIDDWRTAETAAIRGAVSIDMDGYTVEQTDARNLMSDFGNFSLIRRTAATSITVSGDGGINYVIGTGTALYLTNLPSVSGRIFNIRAIGYHTGVYATGILGIQFDRVNIQQAEYGWFILGNSTFEPNSLLLSNCVAAACRTWGYRIVDGGAIEWHGGVITGCGQMTGDAGGILYKASAIQPTGIDVSDVYFEANRGLGDVVIDVAVGAPVIQPNTVRHCLFARNYADFYTAHNVMVRVSGTISGTLALIANGHRGFGTYVPSASRKYVGTTGTTTGLEIVHVAPKYESATEDPRVVAAAVHSPSFGVGTSTVAITSSGNNLLLGDSLAIVPGFGAGPQANNAWQFGSPLLRWSTAYTVNLNASGTFTWGAHVYSLPPGTGTKFLRDDGSWVTLGSGTVTSFSFTNGNGITGTVTNPTSTPALSFALGAVTGTSFNGVTGLSSATPALVAASGATPGSATAAARGDHAHSINTGISLTWGAVHTFSAGISCPNQFNINYAVTASAPNAQIRNASNNLYLSSQGAYVGVADAGSSLYFFLPGTDNSHDLGAASFRWKTVYAVTGTINTSDARLKTKVKPLNKAELRAAARLASEIGTFRWKESVRKKGADGARLHVGLTVQRAIQIMKDEGLDPMRYGFICHDTFDPVSKEAMDTYSFREGQLHGFILRGQEERLRRLEAALLIKNHRG